MENNSKHQPPKWADRFLQFYCNAELLEQLQGDVHELYHWRLAEKGPAAAKRSFIWDVIRLFRWSNIKKRSKTQKLNNMGMIRNYFKIGLRNLWKQRMPSTINVLGLSIALACAMVAFKWIENSYLKDHYHEHLDDLFLVTHYEDLEINTGRNARTDNLLIEEILNSVPGIKHHTRYYFQRTPTKVINKESTTFSLFVDEHYLQMFTFQLIAGNINALSQPDQIVINEDANLRYFGQELGLGQQIELEIGGEWKSFTVGAILKRKPSNASMQNYMLVNYSHIERARKDKNDVVSSNFFIQRQAGVQKEQLVSAMNELLGVHNKDNEINPYQSMELEPLRTMAKNSMSMYGGVGSAPAVEANIVLSAIAVFMVVLAVFNYINISLAMVMKRMKEIGIRKVIGSRRRQLIFQFLIENFLLTLVAMVFALLIAGSFLLPAFNDISGGYLEMNVLGHVNLLVFLVSLLLFITFISGIYPAVVASSYKPTLIFRQTNNGKRNRNISAIFLTFQMILATITIVAAVMFVHTNQVNRNLDWGYDQYNKLYVTIPDSIYREPFRESLEANPNVKSIAGTQALIGTSLNGWQFKNGEVKKYAEFFHVGADYPALLGVELVEGRLFDPILASDINQTLVVNETFMDQLQLEFDPDGTTVLQDSTSYTIIGVVRDYFYWSPDQKIRGAALKAVPPTDYSAFYIEMSDGDIIAQKDDVLQDLVAIAPDQTFGVGVQAEVFDGFYEEIDGLRNIMLFTAAIAIFLAAMGLYGLVNINVSSHMKNFGVRKVLGANGLELGKSILMRYRFVFLFAVLIGAPLAVLLIGQLLADIYAYYPSIGFGPLFISVLILLGVSLLTINVQIQKVRRINPAETLRAE